MLGRDNASPVPQKKSRSDIITGCWKFHTNFAISLTGVVMSDENQVDSGRRGLLVATCAAGGVAGLAAAGAFVSTFEPSERAKAAGAPVEVDIADLKPGEMKTVEWRGKPVWVIKRTPDMVASLKKTDGQVADPKSERNADELTPEYARNETRSIKPDILVAVGICSHLGCSPTTKFQTGPQACGPVWNFVVGEQPKCEQMPTATRMSGLIERVSLRAYSGVSSSALRSDFGSATCPSVFLSEATISGVRLMTHTGLPRHSTVFISPGFRSAISTSTGAPAAFARSEGSKVETNAPAAARPATPPAAQVATSRPRRPEST